MTGCLWLAVRSGRLERGLAGEHWSRLRTAYADQDLVSTAAQHPKKHQKEVDEIKIEGQGTDDGVGTHSLFRHRRRHLFQALRVPRRQPREHDHADDGDKELQSIVVPEHADDRG